MILITGDIHGNPIRIEELSFDIDNQEENYVIICGDFGLVWDYTGESEREKMLLDELDNKPFITLFVDGNHECFSRLNSYPVEIWHGGKVHKIRQNVIHLMRGQVFDIQGNTFFTFGGASSHDIRDGIIDPDSFKTADEFRKTVYEMDNQYKMFRIKGMSWWEEELPTEDEMKEGIKNLAKNENKVDYIITHSPSNSELILLGGTHLYKQDKLTDYLENIKSNVEYTRHYFGHMHVNRQINEKDICLYDYIMEV